MVCDKKPASAGFLSFEAHGVQMAGNAWRCCWQWLGVLGAGGLTRQVEAFCYNITFFLAPARRQKKHAGQLAGKPCSNKLNKTDKTFRFFFWGRARILCSSTALQHAGASGAALWHQQEN